MTDHGTAARSRRPTRAPGWPVALLWVLFAVILAALAVLLVRPCGLALPGGGRPFVTFCPPTPAVAADPGAARLAVERGRRDLLQDRRRRLELRLARVPDCQAPPAPPPPEPAVADIPEEDWEERDVSLLEGCWTLINDMVTTDIETHIVYPVDDWRICFDDSGTGRQTIVYENGVACEGEISADFLPDGRLRFADRRDIPCDSGFIIFRIVNDCERLADGTARCIGEQPGQNIVDIESIFRRHDEPG